jgi:hypothetical protein
MRYWVERSWEELGALGHLVVVARDQRALYHYLSQVSSQDAQLLVLLDRRREERRRRGEGATPERRQGDRRTPGQAEALAERGVVVVTRPPDQDPWSTAPDPG